MIEHDPHGPLFTVICTDTNPYGSWQTEFVEHTWVRVGMSGELLRLVGAPEGTALPAHRHARVVRTTAANRHPRLTEDYAPINRLLSLDEWLERERPVGTVMFIDCDMAFRAPIDRRAEPGSPIGQHWWDFGLGERWESAFEAAGADVVGRIQPVTWPMLIHTSDLRPLMRRWIELTVRLRELTGAWESDMMALAAVLAERGLHCELEMLAGWMPWPDEVVGDAPILHFCQPVLDAAGEVLWFKQGYRPWDPIDADPSEAALDYCRDLLRMLTRYADVRRTADAYQLGE